MIWLGSRYFGPRVERVVVLDLARRQAEVTISKSGPGAFPQMVHLSALHSDTEGEIEAAAERVVR